MVGLRLSDPAGASGFVLDWSGRRHWADKALPCRYCTGPHTHLRDSRRKPAHKVCAERAIARQATEYAEAYENERVKTG